jgi:7,8-dihydropterin-6-yl-methyl-4-(beta-D-ribofuranosyl)aminobenzene 5'-phosphate synthase
LSELSHSSDQVFGVIIHMHITTSRLIATAILSKYTPAPTGFYRGHTQGRERIEMTATNLKPLTISIVYDNHSYDPRLKSAWGFSALIEVQDHTLLFDTGGDGSLLTENLQILGFHLSQVESVVLSHAHGDHTGGLNALLSEGLPPKVYLLPSFPQAFKHQAGQISEVIEVTPRLPISEDIFTTGEIGYNIPEQAMVIKTDHELMVITGCAHPGIVEILKRVRKLFADPVHLVLGGFHLRRKSEAEINSILQDFYDLQVEKVGPCHCSGDLAITMFAAKYRENFIQVGVGKILEVKATNLGETLNWS